MSDQIAVKPLGDRLIVQHVDRESTTPGGVHLPDTHVDRPQEGHVLAVGADADSTQVRGGVRTGDRIVYSKYAGSEIKIDGREVLIISLRDVLAVYAS